MVDETKNQQVCTHTSRYFKLLPGRKFIITQAAVAVLIFLLGIIAGGGGTVMLLKDKVVWLGSMHKSISAAQIAADIKSKYGLSEEQAVRVEEIFTQGNKKRTELHTLFDQQMETGKKEIETRMEEVLTAEQFSLWHAEMQKRCEKFKKESKFMQYLPPQKD